MSEKLLAELLDQLAEAGEASVAESEDRVTVFRLSAHAARQLFAGLKQLHWDANAFDSANNEWREDELSEEFAPYRVTFSKPPSPQDSLLILTNVGFAAFLEKGHAAAIWKVANFGPTLKTLGRLFLEWDAIEVFSVAPPTKNPRLLVRESATPRKVTDDIRPWILIDSSCEISSQAARIWADFAIHAALYSVADEVDSTTGQLKFKGPPRLALTPPGHEAENYGELGAEGFKTLQDVLAWVYENTREAEVRHILFASEIARSGGGQGSAVKRLQEDASGALEGAKIAYQMSVSELGKDTIKTLSDLKKTITEDTSKVADATRQTITAVASALALGLGLVGARVMTATAPWLIFVVMVVVAMYVTAIIYAGYELIRLQRDLRGDWQPRLYRFLSEKEYARMVVKPTSHAERTFFRCSVIGSAIVISLSIALGYSWIFEDGLLRNGAANAAPAVKSPGSATTVEDIQSKASEKGAGVATSKTLENGLPQNKPGSGPGSDPSKLNLTQSSEKKVESLPVEGRKN